MASAIRRLHIAQEKDFDEFRELLREDYPGFVLKTEDKKKQLKVWAKDFEGSPMRLFKAAAVLNVPVADVYDVLHDAEYRATWDENDLYRRCAIYTVTTYVQYMLEAKDLYRIDNNNDVGYYLSKRSWFLSPDKSEFIIMNSSILLKDLPPRKGIIRAVSYITGYHAKSTPTGCYFSYVTLADVKGKLPKWLVNVATSKGAPSLLAKIQKGYPKWKGKHKPDFKPWLKPEQAPANVPVLAPADFDKVQDSPQAQPVQEVIEPEVNDDAIQAELEFSAKLALESEPASEPTSP